MKLFSPIRRFAPHLLAFVGAFVLPAEVVAQEQFVPLTSLPGLNEIANADGFISGESLPAFFNSLYRLCIGAAAVIAVIQIIRAGVMFMTNKGSISANKDAKDMLANAIFGIVLVLSPVIVFGIINPDILRLDLNLEKLKVDSGQTATTTNQNVNATATDQYKWRRMFTNVDTSAKSWREGGPFSTEQACNASFSEFLSNNASLAVSFDETASVCICDAPVSKQPSCKL